GRNDFSSFEFWLSCGNDLKRLSLGEVNSADVGDCQVSILVASFAALPLEATISALFCAADLGSRDLLGRCTVPVRTGIVGTSSDVLTTGGAKLVSAGTFAKAEYVGRGCEYRDHTASEIKAQTSNAVTAANERLNMRRGRRARDCA